MEKLKLKITEDKDKLFQENSKLHSEFNEESGKIQSILVEVNKCNQNIVK